MVVAVSLHADKANSQVTPLNILKDILGHFKLFCCDPNRLMWGSDRGDQNIF